MLMPTVPEDQIFSFKDKLTGKVQKFKPSKREAVVAFKGRPSGGILAPILGPLEELFLGPPENLLRKINEDGSTRVTGYSLAGGVARVRINKDDPTALGGNFGRLTDNLDKLHRDKDNLIYDYVQAMINEPSVDSPKYDDLTQFYLPDPNARYFLPGSFAFKLKANENILKHSDVEDFVKRNNLEVQKEYRSFGTLQCKLPSGMDLFQTIEHFNAMSEVKFAGPVEIGFDDALDNPDETKYATDLWGVKRIRTVEAWHALGGSHGTVRNEIIVVPVDTGVYNGHEDLGYFDGPYGGKQCILPLNTEDWDFTDNSNKKPDDTSPDGHGTNVAGVIGAFSPNIVGTVGVAPNVRIMPLKVDLTSDTGSAYLTRADAINYIGSPTTFQDKFGLQRGPGKAVADGNSKRYIINLSWKCNYDSFIYDAIQDAIAAGVLVVAAAGDASTGQEGKDIRASPESCPAAWPGVLAVASSTGAETKYSTSNYGIDVVYAPGVSIYTTHKGASSYATRTGTSMAAAFVSGVAALIYTRHYYSSNGKPANSFDAGFQGASVATIIRNHTDPITSPPPVYNCGRVNAEGCVNAVP